MPRYAGNVDAVRSLVRETEVHRDIYVDEEVFQLEMEHLFANTWVYVGHDSQTPNSGDFYGTTIGTQPVLMVRHTDGNVKVLYNRCPHKGTQITGETHGNTGKFFRCPYHAWSFSTDGSLIAVPLKNGYENTGFEASHAAQGMTAVRHVRNYRGFVFAKLNDGGATFEEFFGESLSSLDNMVDRSPGRTARSRRRRIALYAQLQLENAGRKSDRYLPSHGGARIFGGHGGRSLEQGAAGRAQADGGGNLRAFHVAVRVFREHGHPRLGQRPRTHRRA